MAEHPHRGITFAELIALPNRELNRVMAAGVTPRSEHLAGWEFRGYNPPLFARLLLFQKFMKGFFLDEAGKLAGYNLVVRRPWAGPDAPWETPRGGGAAHGHGFYDVEPPSGRYTAFPNAVLLNYGSGRNFALNPEGRIRDYLVQVDPDNPDLYLGKAYIDLWLFGVHSNFFVLERAREAP